MSLYAFLADLHEGMDGYVELRHIRPKWSSRAGPYLQSWHRSIDDAVSEVARIQKEVKDSSLVVDTYFGVARRANYGGGTKQDCNQIRAVWVDIDSKDFGGSKYAAYKGVWSSHAVYGYPTWLVDTGHGYHAYWVFKEATDRLGLVEAINSRLISEYRGDLLAKDWSRVLRVPETVNVKEKDRYVNCKIVNYSGQYFDTDYFGVPDPGNRISVSSKSRGRVRFNINDGSQSVDLHLLDSHWQGVVLNGHHAYSGDKCRKMDGSIDRSSVDFAVCKRLVGAGFTDQQIAYVLTNPSYGISEKVLELPDRLMKDYVSNKITKARQRVEEDASVRVS